MPVLVRGETGTGKELVARALHGERTGAFTPVDCGALASSLVESELFGHRRGAFTGAHTDRVGLVESTAGGTLFLDEVGELPLDVQTRLLRLLDAGTFRPVGATEQRRARVRIVAATWRDLDTEVDTGRFRRDLLHRLRVVELRLPPLRELPDDVPVLLKAFLEEQAELQGGAVPRVTEAALQRLRGRPWPGNVRELRNLAAWLVALGPAVVHPDDLPRGRTAPPSFDVRTDLPYLEARRVALDQFQETYVRELLRRHDGNISAAAREAEMDRRSVQRILQRLR